MVPLYTMASASTELATVGMLVDITAEPVGKAPTPSLGPSAVMGAPRVECQSHHPQRPMTTARLNNTGCIIPSLVVWVCVWGLLQRTFSRMRSPHRRWVSAGWVVAACSVCMLLRLQLVFAVIFHCSLIDHRGIVLQLTQKIPCLQLHAPRQHQPGPGATLRNPFALKGRRHTLHIPLHMLAPAGTEYM